MREILASARSIRALLGGTKYTVDYYQREYRWQSKQVEELLMDLAIAFLESYEEGDARSRVGQYGHYFLGSIIVSQKDGQNYIVDGQQRLTTLTLLLTYLHNLQRERESRVKLDDLIYSERFGQKSFNLDIEERTPAMRALFEQEPFDPAGRPESVQNIVARYSDIQSSFPEDLTGDALPYFIDWLIENVHLVQITAYSDEDAYTIFETMNDRGLSLTPLDMLKGFVLSNVEDEAEKTRANRIWRERIQALQDLGKEEDADAFKAWLRSQFAMSTRERHKGATPADFDRIGSEFHRWVRDHQRRIGLERSDDFVRFVTRDLDFYSRQYIVLRRAARSWADAQAAGLETVFYNAQHQFTLQYPLLLAPLRPDDSPETIRRKQRIVATFIDLLIARRAVNYLSLTYSAMEYAMFLVIRDIRGRSAEDVAEILLKRLDEYGVDFGGAERGHRAGMRTFALNNWSMRYIRQILARMTDHIERQSGMPSRFAEYVAEGRGRFEVEHIWANHPERHADEFSLPSEFADHRNRVGGLLLLPKQFNASYGDLPYEQKLPHYFKQNLLAQSLHPQAYEHNPGFVRYVRESGLPFRPYEHFHKKELEERQVLYRLLAEEIWSADRLIQEMYA